LRDIVAARGKPGQLKLGDEATFSTSPAINNADAISGPSTIVSGECAGMNRSGSYLSKRQTNSAPDIQADIAKRQRTATMDETSKINAVFPFLSMQQQASNYDWLNHGLQNQQQGLEQVNSRSSLLELQQSSPCLHSLASISSSLALRNGQQQPSVSNNVNCNDFNTRQQGSVLSASTQERLLRQLQPFNSTSLIENRLASSFWQDSHNNSTISQIYSGETTLSAAQQEHDRQQQRRRQQQIFLQQQMLRQGI
jgi:hypothetical protein